MIQEEKLIPTQTSSSSNVTSIIDFQTSQILGIKRERNENDKENENENRKIKKEVSSNFEEIQKSNNIPQLQKKSGKPEIQENKLEINIDEKNNNENDIVKNQKEIQYDIKLKNQITEMDNGEVYCNICKNGNSPLYLPNQIMSSKLIKDIFYSKLNFENDFNNIILIGIDKILFNLKKSKNKKNIYVCGNCIPKELINSKVGKLLVLYNKDIFEENNKDDLRPLEKTLLMNIKILEKISSINKKCKSTILTTDNKVKELQTKLDECMNDLNTNIFLLNKFLKNHENNRIGNFFPSNVDIKNETDFIDVLKNLNHNIHQISNEGSNNENKYEINLCNNNQIINKNIGIRNDKSKKYSLDNNFTKGKNESISIFANKTHIENKKIIYQIFTKNPIHEVRNESYPKKYHTKIYSANANSKIEENELKYNIRDSKSCDNFNTIRNTNNLNNGHFNKKNSCSNNIDKNTKNVDILNDINITNNDINKNGINNTLNYGKIYTQYNDQIKEENYNYNNINNSEQNYIQNKKINNSSQTNSILLNHLIPSFKLNHQLLNQFIGYKNIANNNNIPQTINSTNINDFFNHNLNQKNSNIPLNYQNFSDQNKIIYNRNSLHKKTVSYTDNYPFIKNDIQNNNICDVYVNYKKYKPNINNILNNNTLMNNNIINNKNYLSNEYNLNNDYKHYYNTNLNGMMNLNNNCIFLLNQLQNYLKNNKNLVQRTFDKVFNHDIHIQAPTLQKIEPINNLSSSLTNYNFSKNVDFSKNNSLTINNNQSNNFNDINNIINNYSNINGPNSQYEDKKL